MNVYMNRIIQKTYISIDEEGTETSAATEWVVAGCSFEEIFEFKADKPFTYFIRDNVTGEILFMGEYAYTN
jgi:serpin B